MLTLTLAGDEAGDVSFSFAQGASRYFVIAMIASEQPDALRQTLANVRQAASLPADYDFSFHAMSSAPLRQRVFAALLRADFEAWAVIVDKPALPDSFKIMHRLDFYLYFVTEVIQLIPESTREGATLILDEFISPARLRSELRRVMRARSIPRRFKRVLTRRSQSESLIQIADLVAGAVLRRDAKSDADTYQVIMPKLRKVMEFRG